MSSFSTIINKAVAVKGRVKVENNKMMGSKKNKQETADAPKLCQIAVRLKCYKLFRISLFYPV